MPGIGSPNVYIGGLPAWRAIIDVHKCPVSTPQTHGGGFVANGSLTVLINNMSAVRQGDKVVEVGGGPNAITLGCPTVIIGG
jgi:uncharacterized Zn-binding protein involved in type VI secretion